MKGGGDKEKKEKGLVWAKLCWGEQTVGKAWFNKERETFGHDITKSSGNK